MTDVTSAPSSARRIAAALAAGTLAGTATMLPAGPAGAAGPCGKPLGYAADASAETLRLAVLDGAPLGLRAGRLADVRVAVARSAMVAGAPVSSAAAARLLDARLAGGGTPEALLRTVDQQAPPTNSEPAAATVLAQRVGPVALGVGTLRAHARWAPAMTCGTATGEVADSDATVLQATVLPAREGLALARIPAALRSRTGTELQRRGGAVHSVAQAATNVSTIELFGGALVVKVVAEPTLRVSTAGTAASATVEYTAPVLQISGRGVPARRLDAPGRSVEVAVPAVGANPATAAAAARAAKLPLVGGDPLGAVADAAPDDRTPAVPAGDGLAVPGMGAVPGAPGLPGRAAAATGAVPGNGAIAVVRLTVGELQKQVTEHGVHARAAALRVQVLAGPARGTDRGRPGYGGGAAGTVLDLGVGLLETVAVAPGGDPGSGTSGGAGPVQAGPDEAGPDEAGPQEAGRQAAVAGLPVTGAGVGAVAATGAALLAVGAGILLVSRRRRFRA